VLGLSGPLYGIAAGLLGLGFIASAVRVWFDATDRSASRMFGYSILYLFLLFAMLIADKLLAGVA
jgi:protoheme IX farnesyltransferase